MPPRALAVSWPDRDGGETMKRSTVNTIIREADDFIRSFGYVMPPFAYWTPEEMKSRRSEIAGIVEGRLGWDITDYGRGDFPGLGLFLFTVRNGRASDLRRGRGMLYAEKIMISRRDQLSPMHRHDLKAEDIVNRGGAKFVVELVKVDRAGAPLHERFRALKDVKTLDLQPGARVTLEPGESLTLEPFIAHAFWAEGGTTLAGEVSLANDDGTDNYFLPPLRPFAPIEEDRPRRYVTVRDSALLVGA